MRGETAIEVRAPARLHMGFLDPTGSLGRRYLGFGLAIDEPATVVRVCGASRLTLEGAERQRTRDLARRLLHDWDLPPVRIRVEETIPAHVGLGSGTQLALAVGTAIARYFDIDADAAAIAALCGRGGRSGLGIGAFAEGGFLLDGGRSEGRMPPPLLARHPFPRNWRVLLIRDPARSGLSGAAECSAFRQLPAFPEATADRLARVALLCVLPGVATGDLALFARGVAEIQERIGDWFAPFQEGGRWSSPEVGAVLEMLRNEGIGACGQSSWGPTGFAVVESERAELLRERLAGAFPALRFRLVRGRNRGARVAPIGQRAEPQTFPS